MTPQPAARPLSPAAAKVAQAMTRHREPATAKTIAALAGVAYSTTTPALRELRTHGLAAITDPAAKPSLWQLTNTEPTAPDQHPEQQAGPHDIADQTDHADQTPDQTANQATDEKESADRTADRTDQNADQAHHADEPHQVTGCSCGMADFGAPGHDGSADAHRAPDAPAEGADQADQAADQADRGADQTDRTADQADRADRTADRSADHADLAADRADHGEQAADGPDQGDKPRARRSPEKPRRPKGALRAAVLGVIVAAPDKAYKVSEICKALDAANTDGNHNKAGAGAVANALDKLAHDGSVHRIEGSPATYQAV